MEAGEPKRDWRAILALVLIGGMGLLGGAALVGLVLALVRDFSALGRPGLASVTFGVLGFLAVWGAAFLGGSSRSRGPILREAEQPELTAVLREVADRIDCGMPRRLRLVPHAAVELLECSVLPPVVSRREVHLGLAFLEHATVGTLRAISVYQFAREQGRTLLGRFAARLHDHLERIVLESRRVLVSLPVYLFARIILWLTRNANLRERRAADARAVSVVGKETYARSLLRMFSLSRQFFLFMQREVLPLIAAGGIPDNLYTGFGIWLDRTGYQTEPDTDLQVIQQSLRELMESLPLSPQARQEILLRVEALHQLPARDGWDDDRLARELIRNREGVEEMLTPFVMELLRRPVSGNRRARPRPVPWEDVAGELIVPQQRAWARQVLGVLGQLVRRPLGPEEGIGVYLQMIEIPDLRMRLAGRLEPGMTQLPQGLLSTLERGILVRFLGSLVGAALVEAGEYRWEKDIGGPLEIVGDDGERLNPFTMAQDLMEGRVDVRVFRMILFEHGLFGSSDG